jgi:uncharacterized membrane protein YfcA
MSAFLAGVLAGLASGFFGVGGGLVTIPLLTGYFHFSQHQAHGTSLAVIALTTLVSLTVYALFGNVAWAAAALIAPASLITARYGARLAARTSARGLARIFAAFLVLVALRLLWKVPEAHPFEAHAGPLWVGLAVVLGLAVGLLSGYMGVGGGILVVPALTLLAGMPQQLAQGTSLAVIVVAAPAGAIEHARHGNVVGKVVPAVACGAALGGPLASWWVQGLPHALLARSFAVLLLANATQTWIRAGRPARGAAERPA